MIRFHLNHRILRIVLPILLLLVIGFCMGSWWYTHHQQQEFLRQRAAADSLALHVAVMPTMGCMPLYYADQHAYFDSLGVDIRLHTYASQMDIDTAIQRGHVAVAYTDLIRLVRLASSGCRLSAFASVDEEMFLVTQRKQRIHKLQDLKEKMVAMARFSITDYLCDCMVDSARLDSDIIFRPQINDVLLRAQMLCNDELDAAWLPQPYAAMCQQTGGHHHLLSSQDFHTTFTVLAARRDILKDALRQRQLSALVQGYNQAVVALSTCQTASEASRVLWQRYGMQGEILDTMPLPTLCALEKVPMRQLTLAHQFLVRRQKVKPTLPLDSLIVPLNVTH